MEAFVPALSLDCPGSGRSLPAPVVLHCPFDPPARKLHLVTASDSGPDELVLRCQRGDKAAFTDLFHRHRSDVARLVYRMLGPVPEVEDVIQDVFVQVFRSLRDFRGNSKFSTWLHRVAVNVVLMHRRAQRSPAQPIGEIPADLTGEAMDPDEDAMRRERIRAFYDVLDRLPEKKRTVFVLHEIEGLTPLEIAKIVDAPRLTVRTRLFYARRDLIRLLREEPSLAGLADVMVRPGSADLATDAEESQ